MWSPETTRTGKVVLIATSSKDEDMEKRLNRILCPQCHRRIKLDEKGRFYRHATRSGVTQADFMADRPKQECPASETRPDNW